MRINFHKSDKNKQFRFAPDITNNKAHVGKKYIK